MPPFRLRSDGSFTLLLVDLLVVWSALGFVRDSGSTGWLRAVFVGVGLVGIAFIARTSLLLMRRFVSR